eukprot:COSAG02_NODE_23357_length_721_cov_0.985531_1_plen_199_part_01
MVVDRGEVAELKRQLRVFRAVLMYPEQAQSKNQAHTHKDGNHSFGTLGTLSSLTSPRAEPSASTRRLEQRAVISVIILGSHALVSDVRRWWIAGESILQPRVCHRQSPRFPASSLPLGCTDHHFKAVYLWNPTTTPVRRVCKRIIVLRWVGQRSRYLPRHTSTLPMQERLDPNLARWAESLRPNLGGHHTLVTLGRTLS